MFASEQLSSHETASDAYRNLILMAAKINSPSLAYCMPDYQFLKALATCEEPVGYNAYTQANWTPPRVRLAGYLRTENG